MVRYAQTRMEQRSEPSRPVSAGNMHKHNTTKNNAKPGRKWSVNSHNRNKKIEDELPTDTSSARLSFFDNGKARVIMLDNPLSLLDSEALLSPRPNPIVLSSSTGGRIEGTSSSFAILTEYGLASTAPTTQQQLRSISVMDMEEVSCLLRESDAELLERHQYQTPNNATPQLSATAVAVLPPDLVLPPPSSSPAFLVSNSNNIHPSFSEIPSFCSSRLGFPRESSTGSGRNSNHDLILSSSEHQYQHPLPPGGESSAAAADELQGSRVTLGGQIYEQQVSAEDLAKSMASLVPSEQILLVGEGTADTETSHLRATFHCIESLDRRLSELAQFAQAVGDIKVADQIQILEDRSDDDDDDDDQEEELMAHQEEEKRRAAALALASSGRFQRSGSSILSPPPPPPPPNNNNNNTNESPTVDSLDLAAPQDKRSQGEENVQSSLNPTPPSPFPQGRGVLGTPRSYLPGHHQKRLASDSAAAAATNKRGFLDQLPAGQQSGQSDYVYKGLRANPPEVIKRGIQRGNYAQLHRKAWLEVSDKYHRYGKNLRFYYRHWESLGCPTNMFFDWLDSKGEAAGQPLPEIEECPRAVLDSDTVLYITDPEVTENYVLQFLPDENGRGRVVDLEGLPVVTGTDGWIFVLRDNRMYGAQKITSVTGHRSKQRFHHSSFFGGKAVAAAGIFITDEQGYLARLYPHSGHYRPREAHMQRVLFFLHHEGVDLRTFDMDMQQIFHLARDSNNNNNNNTDTNKQEEQNVGDNNNGDQGKAEKKKKVESLYLIPAVLAACFLAHKARIIGAGVFEQIHQIRKGNVTTVTEALDFIDDGGYWR